MSDLCISLPSHSSAHISFFASSFPHFIFFSSLLIKFLCRSSSPEYQTFHLSPCLLLYTFFFHILLICFFLSLAFLGNNINTSHQHTPHQTPILTFHFFYFHYVTQIYSGISSLTLCPCLSPFYSLIFIFSSPSPSFPQ